MVSSLIFFYSTISYSQLFKLPTLSMREKMAGFTKVFLILKPTKNQSFPCFSMFFPCLMQQVKQHRSKAYENKANYIPPAPISPLPPPEVPRLATQCASFHVFLFPGSWYWHSIHKDTCWKFLLKYFQMKSYGIWDLLKNIHLLEYLFIGKYTHIYFYINSITFYTLDHFRKVFLFAFAFFFNLLLSLIPSSLHSPWLNFQLYSSC